MIIEMQGNLLESKATIICHQVNCLGVCGAGIAKQIVEKWPIVEAEYKKECGHTLPYYRRHLLGHAQLVETKDSNGTVIANLFAQECIGGGRVNTEYDKLLKCFYQVIEYGEKHGNPTIGIPYKIGCGLGGGDWQIVNHIISNAFADYKGDVLIVRLN